MLKKLKPLFIVVAAVYLFSLYQQNVEKVAVKATTAHDERVLIQADRFSFKCDGRQYCSQMTSYEEAEFFINNCPNTKMDGDRDGIPCERQF